ncbi:alpha/beta fold hydrolase [Streptomyces candidus]|uniref:Pimeloyl-ACP methyl ester carboxylesterase n=1 Tax=Streptomyces candidus TaxID=67283 RepID=A0A7X0LR78_9ACTN|nr:alpha/beta fold hydrolase [Streptomyces candidus]MBB6436681.1 pimeloyl-ACP methyl ester carboxylesterase [Streptomyces candidus]GHH51044.1 peptidase [Streptomyces candidus]
MTTDTARPPLADSLHEFHSQRPRWTTGADEHGPVEETTIEVPRDYADPGGERLTLAVSRRRASDPARRRGVLLSLNGGPGGDWGLARRLSGKFVGTPVHEVYDLIGFDPRGMGDSTRLYAEVAAPEAPFDSRPPDSDFELLAEDMRRRELGCERGGGDLRPHISTRNIARDLDVIRAVLDEPKISFVGFAYGTAVGAVYATLFPSRLDRSVLDSCVNPEWNWYEQFLSQGDAIRRNVDRWAGWAGERDGHFGLGRTPEEVLGTVEEVVALLEKAGAPHLRTLLDGAMGYRTADRAQWEQLGTLVGDLRTAASAADTERVAELLAGQRQWRPTDNEGELRIGVLDAITLESDWPTDLDGYYATMRTYRERYPYGYGVLRAQPWVGTFRTFRAPEPPVTITGGDFPSGIVVQSDGDIMDHYAGGVAMAERLGHHLITVEDSGEHEIYVLGDNSRVDALVHAYLVSGELPPARTTCPGAAPRPAVSPDPAR